MRPLLPLRNLAWFLQGHTTGDDLWPKQLESGRLVIAHTGKAAPHVDPTRPNFVRWLARRSAFGPRVGLHQGKGPNFGSLDFQELTLNKSLLRLHEVAGISHVLVHNFPCRGRIAFA
jgi:hypothetical protein